VTGDSERSASIVPDNLVTMTITVKLFAAARDLTGATEVELELPDRATIADAKHALCNLLPQLAGLLSRSAIARNQEYAVDTDIIALTDELAVIPPVSGG
jgi:molybdopterin converting factor subunit 1